MGRRIVRKFNSAIVEARGGGEVGVTIDQPSSTASLLSNSAASPALLQFKSHTGTLLDIIRALNNARATVSNQTKMLSAAPLSKIIAMCYNLVTSD